MSSPIPSTRTFLTDLISSIPRQSSVHETKVLPKDAGAKEKYLMLTLHVLFPGELLPALDLLDRGLVTRFRIRDREKELKSSDAVRKSELPRAIDNPECGEQFGEASEPAAETSTAAEDLPPTDSSPPPNRSPSGLDPTSARRTSLSTPLEATPLSPDLYAVYYVRSAQPRSRYQASYDTLTSYEVRLSAWNCSCPAFAFAAFPADYTPVPESDEDCVLGSVNELGEEGLEYTGADNGLAVGEAKNWLFGGLTRGKYTPPVCKHLLACVLGERCGLFAGMIEEKNVSVEEAAGWAAGWGG